MFVHLDTNKTNVTRLYVCLHGLSVYGTLTIDGSWVLLHVHKFLSSIKFFSSCELNLIGKDNI